MSNFTDRKFPNALLAFALAVTFAFSSQVNTAEAGHKNYRKAAVIAGVIIGGAIAYNHYKKQKRYKKHYGHARYHAPRHYKRHHGRYHHGHHGRHHYRHHGHHGGRIGPK